MICMYKSLELVDVLKLTGDLTRLRILCCLQDNELAVNELVEILEMNQSAVSNQLSLLKKSELVKFRKEGKRIFYSLTSFVKKGVHGPLFNEIFQRALAKNELKGDMVKLEEILRRRREESLNQFKNRRIKDKSCPGEGWQATARGFAQLISHKNIADLGCGTGRLAAILAEGGNRVTGFDNNPEQLEKAKKLEEQFKGMLTFESCNIEEKNDWAEKYDLVILSHTLHHLTHPARVIRNIASMVKPGSGQVLIFDLAAHEEEIFKDMFGDFWLGFKEENIEEWLYDAGFDEIHIQSLPMEEQNINVKTLIVTARRV
jgi:2-polyprenyl-3-methyl-5-hydroxy-6-metoxy-1,4-benzoquinol methylase